MTDSDFQDRRKNGRIKGRPEAILVTPNGMHSIQDISAGGLSFFCDESEILPTQLPIEIIFAGTPLYMKDIPVRLVREETSDDGDSGSHLVKKVGIEFLELDVHNALLLEKLFKYLTEGNA